MRVAKTIVALLTALVALVPGAVAAAEPEPKVVLVVGPAGVATDRYREEAEAAAEVAEQYTSNVVRIYSPEATWPVVRDALDGAAVVVYMGHGNGWPSKYRDSLFGVTQNGFGLNPVAGGGDDVHQYFGEDAIAADVQLAENAVVLLHHLCYASGNTEPGLPEGTLEDAKQRVDNYAAGFIRAGAGAVVAEGHLGPAWYVEQLLDGESDIQDIWQQSPNAHDNRIGFESLRSPGFTAVLDPDTPDGGYYRSIVYRDGVGAGQLTPTLPAPPPEPSEPTLIGTGATMLPPYFKARPLAATTMELWVPIEMENRSVLEGTMIGVRWDPIDVDAPPADADGAEAEAAAPAPPTDPSTGPVTFFQPEVQGAVVEPIAARVGDTRLRVDVDVPENPGRYRLVTTLHDAEGVAFDAPTQALIPPLIVQVSGELEARYLVAETVSAGIGERFDLGVAVANVGSKAWGQPGSSDRRSLDERAIAGTLNAHWVRLDGAPGEVPADVRHRLPAGLEPGATKRATLAMTAPEAPGSYLLVLDVVITGVGSLTGHGVDPALVRVTVE